jgi:hypothetical protein
MKCRLSKLEFELIVSNQKGGGASRQKYDSAYTGTFYIFHISTG